MKPLFWRMLGGAGVLALLAVGLVRGGCRTVPGEQAAVREGPGTEPDGMDETRRAEYLDQLGPVLAWAIEQRMALLSDLLAGRLTLFETAAGFRVVQRVKEKYFQPVALRFPGNTEEEQLCRQVIAYTETRLQDDPKQAAVVARLEKELQEHLDRYGRVRLPEAPPPSEGGLTK
jgi:hypothetical protein